MKAERKPASRGARAATRPIRAAAKPVRASVTPTFKALAAAGVVAAALVAVLINVLVARFYKRWDWTKAGIYTLSQATVETLRGLNEPVEVIVFLSASDPLTVSVRHMLSAYGAETTRLSARYVDPDRSPAEFLALQQKYGILAGKTEEGRVVTDASLVVVRGERHWFITSDDIVSFDEEEGRNKPKLEQALTEAIRNVMEKQTTKICFTSGHQEMSIDDGGPNGLGELRSRLQKNNYEILTIDLGAPKPASKLEECQVVAMVGPEVRVPETVSERLARYLTGGGNLLVLANPILDDENRIQPTGLDAVGRAAGVDLQSDFIIEKSEQARLPQGLGETFFATPKPHGITAGLVKDEKPRFKVVASAAQSLKASPGSKAQPLLVTSAEAFSLKDVRPFVEQGKPVVKSAGDPGGPFDIAHAVELPKPSGSTSSHGPRAVIAGTANLAWSRNWRDPTLLGNRFFMESTISWLAARPALVSVPDKPAAEAGIALTEESLGELMRYVLIYMPLAAVGLGTFVLLRRRSKEKRSRAGTGPGSDKSERIRSNADQDED